MVVVAAAGGRVVVVGVRVVALGAHLVGTTRPVPDPVGMAAGVRWRTQRAGRQVLARASTR